MRQHCLSGPQDFAQGSAERKVPATFGTLLSILTHGYNAPLDASEEVGSPTLRRGGARVQVHATHTPMAAAQGSWQCSARVSGPHRQAAPLRQATEATWQAATGTGTAQRRRASDAALS